MPLEACAYVYQIEIPPYDYEKVNDSLAGLRNRIRRGQETGHLVVQPVTSSEECSQPPRTAKSVFDLDRRADMVDDRPRN